MQPDPPAPVRFQPIGSYALVRLLPEAPRSSTLAVITSESLTQRAEVLALGQGIPDLAVGDIVYCRPLHGHQVGGDLLLPSTAILATEAKITASKPDAMECSPCPCHCTQHSNCPHRM